MRHEPQIHFAHTRAVANLQPGIQQLGQWRRNTFFQGGFADAQGLECANVNGIFHRQLFSEQGRNRICVHWAQFARRSGQHDQPTLGCAHYKARRGAMVVGQHDGARRHLGLPQHSLRHGAFDLAKNGRDAIACFGMFFQGRIEQLSDALARDIIARGAEAAGDDDQFAAGNRLAHSRLNGRAGIGHGLLMGQFVSGGGELLAEPLLVSVENASVKEFAAGVDKLNAHERSVPWSWIRRNAGALTWSRIIL